MKDRTEFFWLTLIIGGGGTTVLVLFREHLPELFSTIFLYVIWSFLVVVFAVKLIQLLFGGWLNKLHISIKDCRQYRARQKLVKEWHNKWVELVRLIWEVKGTGWRPSDEQQNNYSGLHFWFIENRSRLLPVWHSFQASRTPAAHERQYDSQYSLAHEVFEDYYGDPFSYFYQPLFIQELGQILRGRRDDDITDVLLKLRGLAYEFVQWAAIR